MRPIPRVGQTLYSLNVGNSARNKQQALTEVTVVKVGRKYFYTAKAGWEEHPTRFNLEDWSEVTEYSADQHLYAAPEDWEVDKEAASLYKKLARAFSLGGSAYRLPLPALRKVADIIFAGED